MRTINSTLATEMAKADYKPITQVLIEQNLPQWTKVATGTSVSCPLGHDAIVSTYGGTTRLLRAKYVYTEVIPGWGVNELKFACITSFTDPTTWEAQFATVGSGMSIGTKSAQEAMVSLACSNNTVAVFFVTSTGALQRAVTTDWGSNWTFDTVSSSLPNGTHQLAAVSPTQVFTVEPYHFDPPGEVSHSVRAPIEMSAINYYYLSGSTWISTLSDGAWPLLQKWWFHQMCPQEGQEISDYRGGYPQIWGDPVWGGMGAVLAPDGSSYMVVTSGFELNALSSGGSRCGVYNFYWRANSNLWWENPAIYQGDYTFVDDGYRYFYSNARCRWVGSKLVATFLAEEEPSDVNQTDDYQIVPRQSEVVMCWSTDGENWTEPQPICLDGRTSGVGPVVLIGNYLYMISYVDIYRSAATWQFMDTTSQQVDMTDYVLAWQTSQSGRSPDTELTLNVVAPLPSGVQNMIETDARVTIKAGANCGGSSIMEQVAAGGLDVYSESADSGSQQGVLHALVAGPLVRTRSRVYSEMIPQDAVIIAPSNIDQWVVDSGRWKIVSEPKWADTSCANMNPRNFICMPSHSIAEHLWHQIAYFTHRARSDNQIELSVRMGPPGNWQDGTSPHTMAVPFKDTGGNDRTGYMGYIGSYPWRWAYSSDFGLFREEGGSGLQNYSAVGIIGRSNDNKTGYAFVWEAGLPEWTSDWTMNYPDNWDRLDDAPAAVITQAQQYGVWQQDYNPLIKAPCTFQPSPYWVYSTLPNYYGNNVTGWRPIPCTTPTNYLVLYYFDFYNGEISRNAVMVANSPQAIGQPMQMRMVCDHRYIHCYTKTWDETSKTFKDSTPWAQVFEYSDANIFGAGRFGFYGRGFLGFQAAGEAHTNMAWAWDAKISSPTRNLTVDDAVKAIVSKSGVEVETKELLTGIGVTAASGGYIMNTTPTLPIVSVNPVVDFNLTPLLASESGAIFRWLDASNYIKLGISGSGTASNAVLRVCEAGVETVHTLPIWRSLTDSVAIPVRMTAIDEWYSIWVGRIHLATFWSEFQGGTRFGYYGSVTSYTMKELSEIPWAVMVDSNRSVLDNLDTFLAKRRIKRFLTYQGKLKLGYFTSRETNTTASNTMLQNSLRVSNNFLSHVKVSGAAGWAEYKSTSGILKGRYYAEVDMPDIFDSYAMWKEAKAIVRESGEMLQQDTFLGYPNLAIEPEDILPIVVTTQGIDGDFIVDDLALSYAQQSGFLQTVSTRQTFVE